jgi:hypothetical protein
MQVMKKIVLLYRHTTLVNASVDPDTKEVTFDDQKVTGKMWMVIPKDMFVEIIEEDGKYFLRPAT